MWYSWFQGLIISSLEGFGSVQIAGSLILLWCSVLGVTRIPKAVPVDDQRFMEVKAFKRRGWALILQGAV
jgi:hypothetical protein